MFTGPVHASLLGIYYKLGSLLLFCTMDAMVKALGGVYGPFQLMLFRSTVAMLPVAIIVWRAGDWKIVRSKRPWLQAARIVAGIGSSAGFFYVFPRMPLVDAYAISFAAPFFMVGLSVPLLGEQVGWRRWTAVAVGFVGVIIMLDPLGLSFHTMSLVVLGATFCYSLSTVLVRVNSRHDSDAATLFWFSIVTSVVSFGAAIPDWVWPTRDRLGLAAAARPAGRGGAGAGDAGLAARPGRRAGAVRLCRHRHGGAVRLPVVQGGAVLDGLARPAAGDRLGPLYPVSRAGQGPRASGLEALA